MNQEKEAEEKVLAGIRLTAQHLDEVPTVPQRRSKESIKSIKDDTTNEDYSEYELLVNKIIPISDEIKKLLQDQSYLDSILLDGVEKANKIASKKIKNIKETVGF